MPNYYTVAKIGETRAQTPEGFLIVRDVPIARTGIQQYHPIEINRPGFPDIVPNREDGLVDIYRDAEDVFDPDTIASFAGQAIIDEHPPAGVDGIGPDNWSEYQIGVVLNPRRGDTAETSDLLIADLKFTTRRGIDLVNSGKIELSCGYDCDYYQDPDTKRASQRKIIGNHVALVTAGRCGSRCAIGDKANRGELEMPDTKDKKGIWGKIFGAAKDGKLDDIKKLVQDEAGPDFMSEATPGNPAPATNAVGDKGKWNDAALDSEFEGLKKKVDDNHSKVMDGIEELKKAVEGKKSEDDESAEEQKKENKEIDGEIKEEAPTGSGEDAVKAKDSVLLGDSFGETIAMAEILAPGIKLPTFDAKLDPITTFKSMCALRRKALKFANNDAAMNSSLMSANGGKEVTSESIDKMKCGDVRRMFFAAGTIKREENNRNVSNRGTRTGDGMRVADKVFNATSAIPDNRDINARNKDFWAKQNKK